MSVEVKTPTRTQFEHVEFQCGEKQTSSPFHNSEKRETTTQSTDGSKCQNPGRQTDGSPKKAPRQVTISEKLDCSRQENYRQPAKRRRFSTPAQRGHQYGPGSRKRRYSNKQEKIVLPTKFLLGGNIRDPLNLNSLYDDEAGMLLNQKTPKSSPLPFPSHRENVNLVIPPNITDPLNLNSGEDIDDTSLRFSAKKRRRHKHKKKQDEQDISLSTSSATTVTPGRETEKKKNLSLALKIDIDASQTVLEDRAESDSELVLSNQKKCEDKIVSPVIPQSSKSRKRRRTISECSKPEFCEALSSARRALLRTESVPFDHVLVQEQITPPLSKKMKRQVSANKTLQPPKPPVQTRGYNQRKKSTGSTTPKFIYGNYNRYYGYRNPQLEPDIRLSVLRRDWFEGKDVLDIGCNVGHITLAVAKDFKPRKIVGMDIDGKLISAARKNVRHYITSSTIKTDKYPVSAKLNYGPISTPSVGKSLSETFPNNILFIQGNYVLEYDELLDIQKEDYDIVMALSVTKWIHLNFGDMGLKRFFKRIFKQLRPGGRLILEPQAWPSYKKKKKLTDTIFSNFKGIRFKPDQFTDFLLSCEVGFSTCEAIEVPFNKSAGFRRAIQLFRKPDTSVNSPNPLLLEDRDEETLPTTLRGQSADSIQLTDKPSTFSANTCTQSESDGNKTPPVSLGKVPVVPGKSLAGSSESINSSTASVAKDAELDRIDAASKSQESDIKNMDALKDIAQTKGDSAENSVQGQTDPSHELT